MICVSYVRTVSCIPEKQIPSDIISRQNSRIREYIKGKGWTLAEKYADRKKDENADEAFQQMRMDGINRKFDIVVVDSVFRCGRNVSYAEDLLLKTFYPAGIHFAVVEDGVCSICLTADEAADYFKKKKYEAMGAAMTYRTRMQQSEGYYSVHDEKYGYLLTEDRRGFVVDEEAAPVIREIFYLASEKELPYTEIAKILNEKGYEPPMQHLARVSHKKRTVVNNGWVASSVKRVVDNTAYIGYWYKMIDGVRMKVEIEPLIGQETFDKVKKLHEAQHIHSPKGAPRSDNAFIKQIFDKKTDRPLMCRLHREEPPYQTFCIGFWDKARISYDYVMGQAVEALRREQKKAVRAMEAVQGEEAGAVLSARKDILAQQAKKLFGEMTEIEKPYIPAYRRMEADEISESEHKALRQEITDRLAEKETAFAAIMDEVEMLETAFSKRNPWIKFYAGIEIPDVLVKAQIRKWIDRVTVEDMERVEVIFPAEYMRWREMLPSEWIDA